MIAAESYLARMYFRHGAGALRYNREYTATINIARVKKISGTISGRLLPKEQNQIHLFSNGVVYVLRVNKSGVATVFHAPFHRKGAALWDATASDG